MRVGMIAVEQGIVAECVGQVELRKVEAAAGSDRQARSDIERVGRIEAGIECRRAQPDRRNIARRLVDEETKALHGWKLIGVDRSQFARAGELHEPAVDAETYGEVVVVREQL